VRRQKQTPLEVKEQAIQDIHLFYSRQHFRQGIRFEQMTKEGRMNEGEIAVFCKDFGIKLPRKKQH